MDPHRSIRASAIIDSITTNSSVQKEKKEEFCEVETEFKMQPIG
jgi:hypothetical protein